MLCLCVGCCSDSSSPEPATYSQLLPPPDTAPGTNTPTPAPTQGLGSSQPDTVATATTTEAIISTATAGSPESSSSDSGSTMQAYQALSGQNSGSFGMQNAAAGFYAQSQSPYGMLQQSYPAMSDGQPIVITSRLSHNCLSKTSSQIQSWWCGNTCT